MNIDKSDSTDLSSQPVNSVEMESPAYLLIDKMSVDEMKSYIVQLQEENTELRLKEEELLSSIDSLKLPGEQYITEEEVRERLRVLTNQSTIGILIADEENVFFVNQAFCKLSKLPDSEIYKRNTKSVLQLVHPEDREFVTDQLMKKLRGKTDVVPQYRFRLVLEDSEIRHISLYSEAIKFNGKSAILVTGVDITEQHNTEEALKLNEEKYKSLFENMSSGFIFHEVIFDDKGYPIDFIFREVNESFASLIGYKREDLIGRTLRDVLPEHVIPNRNWEWGKTSKKGSRFKYEGYFPEPLDKWISVSMYCPERGYLVVITDDITERKNVELELARHREKLQELVEERTIELKEAQREILVQEKLATLGQLTAVVSHELRNPLGTIKSSVYTLGEIVEKNENIQRILDRIERAIVRCDVLVEDLLDFTRARDLEMKPVEIDEFLRRVIEDYNFPDGVELKLACGSSATVLLDPERFSRCIINIFDNAVHALKERVDGSGKLISIGCAMNDGSIELKISDCGVGIPESELDRIFEPLYSTKNFGAGLGLSIVKQIVMRHNGRIELESKVNQGTTVVIILPQFFKE